MITATGRSLDKRFNEKVLSSACGVQISVQPLHAENIINHNDIFFKFLFGINIHSAEDGSNVNTTTTTAAGCTTQKDLYIFCLVVGVNHF